MRLKKYIIFPIFMVFPLIISSCFVSYPYEIPYGEWKSENPYICLNIFSDITWDTQGRYRKNGELYDIFLRFETIPAFSIQNTDAIDKSGVNDVGNWYFQGKFEVKNDKLYYHARWSDLTGQGTGQDIRTIVFERVEDDIQE